MDKNLTVPKLPQVKLSLFDKAVNYFSPERALKRVQSKLSLAAYNAFGYLTPGKGKRSMMAWNVSGGSADTDTLNDLSSSRAGSRDLYMNTPIATGVIRRLKTNAVGAGLTVQSRIDRKYLNVSDEVADNWERDAERLWKLWSTSKNCDITRTNTFEQLQGLSFLSYLLSGDVLVTMPYKPVKGFPFQLRLQLIEGDQLCNPSYLDNTFTQKVRGGVEIDVNGAPVFYHIKTVHPGDSAVSYKWKKIRAFGEKSGRRNVIHIFNKERPGQRRGMPFLATAIEPLKMLTRLSESELMGALVSSFYTVFIKNVSGDRPFEEGFVPQDTSGASPSQQLTQDPDTTVGQKNYEMQSGNIVTLDEGQEIDIADPKRPNDSFEPFFLAIVKQLGASFEIPFEVLMQHFSSSYSASRAALLEAWKTFKMYRKNFVVDFCQPVYEEFLTEQVISGNLVAPGFLTDPLSKLAWCGSKWGGPGQGEIDPMKETKASILKVRNHLSTHEDEAQTSDSGNWEDMVVRLAKENKVLEENDLIADPNVNTENFAEDTNVKEDNVNE